MSAYSVENPFRPFCSERCKLIDLGAWAQERYAIAGKEGEASVSNQFSIENDAEKHPFGGSKLN
jgi:uncharacterized protein